MIRSTIGGGPIIPAPIIPRPIMPPPIMPPCPIGLAPSWPMGCDCACCWSGWGVLRSCAIAPTTPYARMMADIVSPRTRVSISNLLRQLLPPRAEPGELPSCLAMRRSLSFRLLLKPQDMASDDLELLFDNVTEERISL